jgi:DNA-binding PadR family transcriptional regulator
MKVTTERGSLWELAVLSLLREAPMHPYQMQRLLRDRHEDEVLGLKRGSLYNAINRLTRSGLIEPATVGREGRRPERTTYRLTADGRREFVRWLRQRIATPQQEPSEFMGSISFLVHLTPDDAAARLESRAEALDAHIQALTTGFERVSVHVARIHLIETEYQIAMHKAELEWVRERISELRSGTFAWDLKKILKETRADRQRAATRKERSR